MTLGTNEFITSCASWAYLPSRDMVALPVFVDLTLHRMTGRRSHDIDEKKFDRLRLKCFKKN